MILPSPHILGCDHLERSLGRWALTQSTIISLGYHKNSSAKWQIDRAHALSLKSIRAVCRGTSNCSTDFTLTSPQQMPWGCAKSRHIFHSLGDNADNIEHHETPSHQNHTSGTASIPYCFIWSWCVPRAKKSFATEILQISTWCHPETQHNITMNN